jgi:hypothetical protein
LERDSVHATDKKFRIVRLDCDNRSMLRRRCGVVIDEEYVQEHSLTGSYCRATTKMAYEPSPIPDTDVSFQPGSLCYYLFSA